MKKLFVIFIALLFHQAVQAQKEEKWEVLGTKEIGLKADYEVIVLTAGNDKISKIKFQVKDSPVDMMRIEVTYDVGTPDQIEMRGKIAEGGESRTVDIRGIGNKKIRKITFWYDTKGLNGNATVTILGVKEGR